MNDLQLIPIAIALFVGAFLGAILASMYWLKIVSDMFKGVKDNVEEINDMIEEDHF